MTWAEKRATDGGTLLVRVEYSYDALGNRVRWVERDGSQAVVADERYALDGWDPAKPAATGTEDFEVYVDLDAAGTVTTRRLFGPGFDEPLARLAAAGAVGWYLADLQGSVRQISDNSATILGARTYSAFGAITLASCTGLDRYAYTAREWDATLGLQFSRARLYDPATGRWLSEDPLGLAAGDVNLFRYVGNAVTTFTDPSGLDWLSDNVQGFRNRFTSGLDRVGTWGGNFADNLGRTGQGYWDQAKPDGARLVNWPSRRFQQFRDEPLTTVWGMTGPGALYNLTQDTTRNIADLPTNLDNIQRAFEEDPNRTAGMALYEFHKALAAVVAGKALLENMPGKEPKSCPPRDDITISGEPITQRAYAGEEAPLSPNGKGPGTIAPESTAGPHQTLATGSEWYDYFAQRYGTQNVEWVSGSGRTITWPSELPLPANTQMFRVRPERGSSSRFAADLETVAGPRPPGAVAHHNQPLMLNGVDNGAVNGSWQFNPGHQAGHDIINSQVLTPRLPYGTEIRILPRLPGSN